jgi:hypothetical protein
MIQLSDTQIAILAAAVGSEDRMVFPITLPIKGGAVGNVLKSLLKRGLLEEVAAGDAHSVWRCGDDGAPLTLVASDAGCRAIAEEASENERDTQDKQVEPRPEAGQDREQGGSKQTPDVPAPRVGAKQEALLALLRRPQGATVADLQAATGWQPHSVRGALSGLVRKKLGLAVTSSKEGDRGRVYRIG